MSSAPIWDTMPPCVPTRLMTKPQFQTRRQEKSRGSVMDAMRSTTKNIHFYDENLNDESNYH